MTKLTPPPDPSQEKKLSFVAFDRKDYSRKYYEQNKEKILLYQKQYYHSKRKQKKKPIFQVRTGSFWLFGVSGFVAKNT